MTENINVPDPEMDKGIQPLDGLMTSLGMTNEALVDLSRRQLSFRHVQKARKGRRIKSRIQLDILEVLNRWSDKKYTFEELFNYRGPKG